jgi:transcriptional regulator with XRE-family HTH domain
MRGGVGEKDRQIGELIRAQRLAKGLTQAQLGIQLGVTYQQIQKYEAGTNRVGAGRLAKIAELLNVPITFFYGATGSKNPQNDTLRLLNTAAAVRFLRAFSEIENKKVKSALVDLTESLAVDDPAR